MAFKMVDNLDKLCGRVAGAAMEHRHRLTDALTDRFRDKLPDGQTIPDILQLQTWLAEELHETHGLVLESEKGLKAELTEDRQDRREREAFTADVRQHLFATRRILDGVYGAGGADVFFNQDPGFRISRDPVPLHRQGLTVYDNILDPSFRRPPLRLDVEVNLEMLAHRMKPSLDGLRRALDVLHGGTQASAASLSLKDTRVTQLNRRTGTGARLLEALYAWAELDGIAQRVRLSSHRATGGDESGDVPAAGPPTLDAGEPDGETPDGFPAGALIEASRASNQLGTRPDVPPREG